MSAPSRLDAEISRVPVIRSESSADRMQVWMSKQEAEEWTAFTRSKQRQQTPARDAEWYARRSPEPEVIESGPVSSASHSAPIRMTSRSFCPVPSSFALQPLVATEGLFRVAHHRMYYPALLLVLFVAFVGRSLVQAIHASWLPPLLDVIGVVFILMLGFISLTQVDRRLMRLLLRSFEYLWLLSNVLVFAMTLLFSNGVGVQSVVPTLAWSTMMLYAFSFDAIIGPTRFIKGCLLSLIVAFFCLILIMLHMHESSLSDNQVCVFFYCTSPASLCGASVTTSLIFALKYLACVLFRPARLLILTAIIECRDEKHGSDLNDSRTSNEHWEASMSPWEMSPLPQLHQPLMHEIPSPIAS
jgi:hypothetical protein